MKKKAVSGSQLEGIRITDSKSEWRLGLWLNKEDRDVSSRFRRLFKNELKS